jgi:glycosyltransferase involved in cell wall biosynthesis
MKVLFVATTFPIPPHAGAKVALLETVRSLEGLCELHLLLPRAKGNSDEHVAELRQLFPNTPIDFFTPRESQPGFIEKYTAALRSAVLGQSYHAAIWMDRNLSSAARRLVEKHHFDIVHCEWLYPVMALQGMNLPLVARTLDLHFVIMKDGAEEISDKRKLRKFLWRLEAERFRKFEVDIFNKSLLTIAVSAEDENVLRREGVSHLVRIPPPMTVPVKTHSAREEKGVCTALFLCMLHAYVNRDSSFIFTDEIWPQVNEEVRARVRVIFAGGRPDEGARRRAAECGIEIRAPLSDDEARRLYAEADIFLSPIKTGTGIKTKTLEAMANGKPIIGFRNSFRGVPVENGVHALIADSNQEFAHLFETLVYDQAMRHRLGEAAREFIRENFNPATLGSQLVNAYSAALESGQQTLAARQDDEGTLCRSRPALPR